MVLKVLKVQEVKLVPKDLPDHQVSRVHPVLMELVELKDQLEVLVLQVHLGL